MCDCQMKRRDSFWTVAPNLSWLLSSPQQPRDGRIHQPSRVAPLFGVALSSKVSGKGNGYLMVLDA